MTDLFCNVPTIVLRGRFSRLQEVCSETKLITSRCSERRPYKEGEFNVSCSPRECRHVHQEIEDEVQESLLEPQTLSERNISLLESDGKQI